MVKFVIHAQVFTFTLKINCFFTDSVLKLVIGWLKYVNVVVHCRA